MLGGDGDTVADLQRRRLIVENHQLRRGNHFDMGQGRQCVENDLDVAAAGEHVGEARKRWCDRGQLGIGQRDLMTAAGLIEILHAKLHIVRQRHFRDDRFQIDLQGRHIELAQRRFDHAVFRRAGQDHQGIVGFIGGDGHARHTGKRTAGCSGLARHRSARHCFRRTRAHSRSRHPSYCCSMTGIR